jgi:hypothetical protein
MEQDKIPPAPPPAIPATTTVETNVAESAAPVAVEKPIPPVAASAIAPTVSAEVPAAELKVPAVAVDPERSIPPATTTAAPTVNGSIAENTEDHAYDLYIEHQKQAWADCQSGSDEFDKSILTYSSAGLGLSVAFIKDIVPIANVIGLPLLYTSWRAFGVAILTTVFSFQLSVKTQQKHLEHLRKYYLERRPEYLDPPNWAASWVGYLKWVSGACFVIAIAGTIGFAIWNLNEARDMSEKKSQSFPRDINGGRMPTSITPLNEGRLPVNMTPLEKGRQPMNMTPLPSNQAPPQQQPSSAPAPQQNKK